MATWRLTVRDRTGARLGVIDTYDKLTMSMRHLDVGTWVLDLPLDAPLVPELVTPGAGLIVERDDVVVLSGPMMPVGVKHDGEAGTVTVSGFDDLLALRNRAASPQPATVVPPYNSQAYDVRTGICETVIKQYVDVNAGPGALVSRRRVGLTVAADQARGGTVTGRARWHNLLTHVVELAVLGGLGVRCKDLVFDVYQPVDRTATVEFSDDRQNLAGYSFERQPPAATYVYVLGGGEGTARTVVEAINSQAIADGWDRIEAVSDRRDTTDPAELAQAATAALIGEGSSSTDRTGVTILPVDTEAAAFGVDYQLGDLVAWVDPWGVRSSRLVQAVQIDITPGAEIVVPTLGSIIPDTPAQFARLQSLARRAARLEVR